MNDESIRKSLETIARETIPENTDLWPRLAARLARKDTGAMSLKWKLVWTIVLVLLGLSVVTGVVYAIGRITGYIPGIGFVQDNSLRVLAEPVSQSRAGITVTIEQVIVDPERTVIVYKTEGLSLAAANSQGEGAVLGSAAFLRLPDGTLLGETPDIGYAGTPEPLINDEHTQGGWPNYVWRLVYPPIPAKVDEAMLLIPVLQTMPAGAAPENWALTFRLKPAPANMTMAPVIAFTPPATPGDGTPATREIAVSTLSSAATHNGFTLQLENVVELEDGFVFTGSLSWEDTVFPAGKGMISGMVTPTLTDPGNQDIPIEEVQVANGYSADEHKLAWSFRTNRKNFSGPLVFSVPAVNTTILPPETDFELDLGPAPQVGQEWDVKRDFVFAGHTIHLSSVQLLTNSDPCWKYEVAFNFASDEEGISAFITDTVPQPTPGQPCPAGGGGGGGGPADPKTFSTGTTYSGIPTGLHHFTIRASIPYLITGPWQVTWTPPAVEAPTPTMEPGACLTLEKWDQLMEGNDPVPAGLGGKIITTVNEGGPLPAIYISSLDGTNAKKLYTGAWPSLSRDGTRLAYSAADGLRVLDLSTGGSVSLGTDGYNLIWSPDSTRILYTTTFHLYVINADGTGLQEIDTGSAQVISSVGWLPDNQTIVYGAMGGDGFTFTTYNLQSRETKSLFSFQNKAGYGDISADGQWIVFSDKVFGAQNWGIFIARLDGTERKLVADPGVPTAFTSIWGPGTPSGTGGQWLILNTQTTKGAQIPVLVDPFTCQSARLQAVDAMVEGWSP